MRFRNRIQAGRLLAEKISKNLLIEKKNTVVIALPRGGVPVAYEIAKELDLPLDILLVKKIGVPFNPEFAMGAVSEDNEVYYNLEVLDHLGYEPDDVTPFKLQALEDLHKIGNTLRQGQAPLPLKNKIVILVDDGIATGATIEVAVQLLKKKKVDKIIIASPVAAEETVRRLETLVDKVVTVMAPLSLSSVGQWYEDFSQVETQEVISLLSQHASDQHLSIPQEVRYVNQHQK